MARARLIRIHKTLYARIPAEDARRLQLQPGQEVDVDVRPAAQSVGEVLRDLRGKYRGRLAKVPDEELWDV